MKDQLQQIIDVMRKHVLKNLELIKTNESHIREVLTWAQSTERTRELNESYKCSKTLLSENNDYINLQVSIMNFMNKYQKTLHIRDLYNKVQERYNRLSPGLKHHLKPREGFYAFRFQC